MGPMDIDSRLYPRIHKPLIAGGEQLSALAAGRAGSIFSRELHNIQRAQQNEASWAAIAYIRM